MALLKVKKNGIIYPIQLYDTESMTGDAGNLTGTLKVKINSKTMYARTTGGLSGACGGDTPLRVKKDGTVYQVTQYGEFKVYPANCLYVFDNNANTFNKRDVGWIGDGESAYYEVHWGDSGSNTNFNYVDVTIPRNCSVVRLEGYAGETANNTLNVKVMPGKTYRIVSWRAESIVQYTQDYQYKYGSGKDTRYTWKKRPANYIEHRYRQLVFTYPDYKNDGSVKTIIVTNSATNGGGYITYKHEHIVNGKYRTTIYTTGAKDAVWGNGGFMRVCFGKGNYNYEANVPDDTML